MQAHSQTGREVLVECVTAAGDAVGREEPWQANAKRTNANQLQPGQAPTKGQVLLHHDEDHGNDVQHHTLWLHMDVCTACCAAVWVRDVWHGVEAWNSENGG